jgi:hypothetical protein
LWARGCLVFGFLRVMSGDGRDPILKEDWACICLGRDLFARYRLKLSSLGPQAFPFWASVWWVWRHQNLMVLNNEMWFLTRLSNNIQSMVEDFTSCFTSTNTSLIDIGSSSGIKTTTFASSLCWWKLSWFSCSSWLIRNNSGFYLSGYSGFVQRSWDIMLVGLYAIYWGPHFGQKNGHWRACLLIRLPTLHQLYQKSNFKIPCLYCAESGHKRSSNHITISLLGREIIMLIS